MDALYTTQKGAIRLSGKGHLVLAGWGTRSSRVNYPIHAQRATKMRAVWGLLRHLRIAINFAVCVSCVRV